MILPGGVMFKRLLVPLDRSSFAECALNPAVTIARASQAEIDFVLVHRPRPLAGVPDVQWHAQQLGGKERYLETIADEICTGAGIPTSHAVLTGDVAEMICERADETEADLIVMTSHGRTGFDRAWVGSVADAVLRKAAVPVLMVKPDLERHDGLYEVGFSPPKLFERILVPLDGSPLSTEVLSSAAALARCADGRLVLLQVIQPVPLFVAEAGIPFAYPPPVQDNMTTELLAKDARESLIETAATLAESGMANAEVHVITAPNVAQAIIDFAHENRIDAVAMSTHGRGFSRLLIGSVADKVLRASGLPILLRRPAAKRAQSKLARAHADSLRLSPATVF
jgi:nucleotide-binding universal stress UspA family protein